MRKLWFAIYEELSGVKAFLFLSDSAVACVGQSSMDLSGRGKNHSSDLRAAIKIRPL